MKLKNGENFKYTEYVYQMFLSFQFQIFYVIFRRASYYLKEKSEMNDRNEFLLFMRIRFSRLLF